MAERSLYDDYPWFRPLMVGSLVVTWLAIIVTVVRALS